MPMISSPHQPLAPEVPRNNSTEYEGSDLEALQILHRYRGWILDEFGPYLSGRTVEIGAGIGTYSRPIREMATRLDLVEPSTHLFQRLTETFAGDARVRMFNMTAEQWVGTTPSSAYDSVVMVNVLEHLADDTAILQEVYRLLRPGGHLLLFVPALMLLYSPLDRLFGHYRRYNLRELRKKARAAGFELQRCRYFDWLGALPWLLINRMAGATRITPGLAGIYDAIGVPLTRAVERVIPPPFGKNIILVGVRPDR